MLDVKRYFFLLLSQWYWLLLGLALALSAAWLYLRYTVDVYEAQSTVLINESDNNRGISEEMIVQDIGFSAKSNVENDLQILQSTDLMQRVVDSLQLHILLEQVGRIRNTERYGSERQPIHLRILEGESLLYGKSLTLIPSADQNAFAVEVGESDTLNYAFGQVFAYQGAMIRIDKRGGMGDLYRYTFKSPEAAARHYAQKLRLRAIGQSGVVSMSIADPEPNKAADILSMLTTVYNQSIIERKNTSGKQTLDFINERLNFITQELYEVESEVEGFKSKNELSVGLSDRASSYLGQLNEADNILAELDLQLQLIDRMQVFMLQDSNRYQTLPISSDVLSGTLGSLVGDYNRTIFEYKQRMEAATSQNPMVATFEEQLDYLRSSILKNVATLKAEINERRSTLKARIAPIERELRAIPANERQLLQIMRQQQIKEQLFLFLLQKREETALGIAAQTVNSRILDAPYSRGPVSPKRDQIYLFAAILGLLFPTAFVLLRDIFDDKIYSQKDLQRYTQAPFIGAVAESKSSDAIVVSKSSRSGIAEMFRLLRTNLQFMGGGQQQQVTLVTSTVSGEGKTFVTINLGMSLALTGKRVVLLGLDLRKPKLSRYLCGQGASVGVTNYLVGEAQIDDILQPVPGQENIDFIGAGPIPPNPAELLMGGAIEQLLTELRDRYDHILIDTAPVGLVADALLLAKLSDQSIMVTRFGVTTTGFLKLLEDLYQQQKLPRLGVVLNGVKEKGEYGYGYGYGYYDDDKRRKKWWKFF